MSPLKAAGPEGVPSAQRAEAPAIVVKMTFCDSTACTSSEPVQLGYEAA